MPEADADARPGARAQALGGGSGCNPHCSPCIPDDRDYDCGELAGPYTVSGSDPYRLDGDGDGIGCE